MRENNFIDMDVNNIQPALDKYLVSKMRQDIQQKNYDFMHGALGVGLYYLKKGTNPEYITELIDFLYNTADKDFDSQIFRWESIIDFEKNHNGYNLSLCHGISSIIIFLVRVIKNGIFDEKVTEMLIGAVNYILSNEKDFSQLGSYFPNYILINSNETVSKSRMAWCYGDLGNAIALWKAGKILENKKLEEKANEIFFQSTRRRYFHETLVNDAGACHGSVGIAMIFRRIYLETNRNEFKEATEYWINRTLNFSHFEDGLAGYKILEKDKWIHDYSLLTGISGIGLLLLSYLKNGKQTWDELFLLS